MKLLPSVFVIGQSAMWSGVWRVRNFIVENSITFHRYDVFHVGLLLHSLIFTDDQNYTKILESDRLAAAICARELRNLSSSDGKYCFSWVPFIYTLICYFY